MKLTKLLFICLMFFLVTACSNTTGELKKQPEKATQTKETSKETAKSESKTTEPSQNKNNVASDKVESQTQAPSVKKTAVFNQSTIDKIYPGWVLKLNQTIKFSDRDVVVAGLQKGQGAWQSQGKVVVLQFDNVSGNWLTKWSGSILVDNKDFPYYEFQSIAVVKSNSQKRALAVVAADCGGSTGYGQALAVIIDDSGASILKEKFDINEMALKQEGNTVTLSGDQQFGTHKLSFQGEQYVNSKTSSADLSPDGAVQVNFKLDNNGNIVLLGQEYLSMSVGQTIAFIPADERTREAFNQGIIGIYSDAWNNGSPLNTSNSDRLWKGNSYTFDKSGEVHFLLVTDEKSATIPFENPIPTITINVQP
ncbi:hypothetical protein RCG17_06735 [Neobacillus sp. PS3-12]|uniref:hypothetical protein n=1 Tax=Neobacillus sp. PS3-12 TaxID=3070677 RepID=UPI0027E20323|nr:hypothetical protein [Neobacillus sp. PS3-12]WML54337.1 hypothetical protein RCG17_06735 [Neobacillus sp. PS3-12]